MRRALVIAAALTIGGCSIDDALRGFAVLDTTLVVGEEIANHRPRYVPEPPPLLACRRDGTDEVFRVDGKTCPPGSTAGPYCHDARYKIVYAAPCVGHDVPISAARYAVLNRR